MSFLFRGAKQQGEASTGDRLALSSWGQERGPRVPGWAQEELGLGADLYFWLQTGLLPLKRGPRRKPGKWLERTPSLCSISCVILLGVGGGGQGGLFVILKNKTIYFKNKSECSDLMCCDSFLFRTVTNASCHWIWWFILPSVTSWGFLCCPSNRLTCLQPGEASLGQTQRIRPKGNPISKSAYSKHG